MDVGDSTNQRDAGRWQRWQQRAIQSCDWPPPTRLGRTYFTVTQPPGRTRTTHASVDHPAGAVQPHRRHYYCIPRYTYQSAMRCRPAHTTRHARSSLQGHLDGGQALAMGAATGYWGRMHATALPLFACAASPWVVEHHRVLLHFRNATRGRAGELLVRSAPLQRSTRPLLGPDSALSPGTAPHMGIRIRPRIHTAWPVRPLYPGTPLLTTRRLAFASLEVHELTLVLSTHRCFGWRCAASPSVVPQ